MNEKTAKQRQLLCDLAEDDTSFTVEEQDAIMAAVTALDALDYVYGNMDILDWRAVVDRKMTPPWPLSEHLEKQGLHPARSDRELQMLRDAALELRNRQRFYLECKQNYGAGSPFTDAQGVEVGLAAERLDAILERTK